MKDFILSFGASFCASIIFNIDRKRLFWAGLSGGIAWVSFLLIFNYTHRPIASTFASTVIVSIYNESMARLLKAPAFVFTIPGIIPLVPGVFAYNAIVYVAENKMSTAINISIETIALGLAIAFGIMLVSAAFYFWSSVTHKNN